MCVSVCVCERERERERCVCVCVCVFVCLLSHTVHVCRPPGQSEEGISIFGTGCVGSSEPPDECWELNRSASALNYRATSPDVDLFSITLARAPGGW